MTKKFKALWVIEGTNKQFVRQIIERSVADLPPGEVLIRVQWSSLNYKDALSATGNKGVTRSYPHTPGIDAAGTVAESQHPDFKEGDEVLVTGYDLGMNTPGGYGGYIRVPAAWVVKLPSGLSMQNSMLYGTAGFTAAISVYKLRHLGVLPEHGPVLVTGATGGVGSIGVGILAKLGYHVSAISGKSGASELLTHLGAKEVLARDILTDPNNRPLLSERWAGVLDTVGGDMLANALKSVKYNGAVTCCGLVASPQLATTVFPFILRGVSLAGVDSAQYEAAGRAKLWDLLANEWFFPGLYDLQTTCTLESLHDTYLTHILKGQVRGRVVVNMGDAALT